MSLEKQNMINIQISATQSVVHGPAASTSPGNSVRMQKLRPQDLNPTDLNQHLKNNKLSKRSPQSVNDQENLQIKHSVQSCQWRAKILGRKSHILLSRDWLRYL